MTKQELLFKILRRLENIDIGLIPITAQAKFANNREVVDGQLYIPDSPTQSASELPNTLSPTPQQPAAGPWSTEFSREPIEGPVLRQLSPDETNDPATRVRLDNASTEPPHNAIAWATVTPATIIPESPPPTAEQTPPIQPAAGPWNYDTDHIPSHRLLFLTDNQSIIISFTTSLPTSTHIKAWAELYYPDKEPK